MVFREFVRCYHSRVFRSSVILAVGAVLVGGAATALADSEVAAGHFVSKRYHYTLTYPPHWRAVHATTSQITEGFPTEPQPAVDKFLSCGENCAKGIDLVVYARKLKQGTSGASFASQEASALRTRFGCIPRTRSTGTVGRAPARVFEYSECLGNYLVEHAVVQNGRGYDFYLLAPRGHEQRDRATASSILRTVRFTR
jgi:hypothetical protein